MAIVNIKEKETFINEVWSEQTGGGIYNDYIMLKSGKVIRISDELICVYDDLQKASEALEPVASVYH